MISAGLLKTFCQSIIKENAIKAYLHFSHNKAMETLNSLNFRAKKERNKETEATEKRKVFPYQSQFEPILVWKWQITPKKKKKKSHFVPKPSAQER